MQNRDLHTWNWGPGEGCQGAAGAGPDPEEHLSVETPPGNPSPSRPQQLTLLGQLALWGNPGLLPGWAQEKQAVLRRTCPCLEKTSGCCEWPCLLTTYHPCGLGQFVHLSDPILSIYTTGSMLITAIYGAKQVTKPGWFPVACPCLSLTAASPDSFQRHRAAAPFPSSITSGPKLCGRRVWRIFANVGSCDEDRFPGSGATYPNPVICQWWGLDSHLAHPLHG